MDNFKIKLLTQNWIDDDPNNDDDLCSHGKVLLMINDIILSDENCGDWTVASSALRLMRSAIYGYDSESDLQIIPCCGYLTMPSCPTYITWDTKINDNVIIISNIQYSSINGIEVINRNFEIDYIKYISQILNFANKVKDFYSSSLPRKFYDKWDEEEYNLFWNEFNNYYKILAEKV